MNCFVNKKDIFEFLLQGGIIRSTLGNKKDSSQWIHLKNGNLFYLNGQSAENCLLSPDMWEPVKDSELSKEDSHSQTQNENDVIKYHLNRLHRNLEAVIRRTKQGEVMNKKGVKTLQKIIDDVPKEFLNTSNVKIEKNETLIQKFKSFFRFS